MTSVLAFLPLESVKSLGVMALSLSGTIGSAGVTAKVRAAAAGAYEGEPMADRLSKYVPRYNDDDLLMPDLHDPANAVRLTERTAADVRSIAQDALKRGDCKVVVAGYDLAASLLGESCESDGCIAAQTINSALGDLYVEMLSRRRLLAESKCSTAEQFRTRFPEQVMAMAVYVFTGVEKRATNRLALLQPQARLLDIHCLLTRVEEDVVDEATRGLTVVETLTVVEPAILPEPEPLPSPEPPPYVESPFPESSPGGALPDPVPTAPLVAPVRLSLFGPVRVSVNEVEVKTGLRTKARELVTFLALRPQGATWDAISTALWPDANAKRANERFRTTLANLRTVLRSGSSGDEKIIEFVGDRYVLNPSSFACDLWEFQDALADVPAEPGLAIAALRRAVGIYSGLLAEGSYFEWIDAQREEVRRRVLDVLGRLAELQRRNGDATGALASLEHVIAIDPYAEDVYQRIMVAQSQLNQPEAVVRTFRLLECRLHEIDIDPSERTRSLLKQLAA